MPETIEFINGYKFLVSPGSGATRLDGWVTARGNWESPGGKEDQILVPPSLILCVKGAVNA